MVVRTIDGKLLAAGTEPSPEDASEELVVVEIYATEDSLAPAMELKLEPHAARDLMKMVAHELPAG